MNSHLSSSLHFTPIPMGRVPPASRSAPQSIQGRRTAPALLQVVFESEEAIGGRWCAGLNGPCVPPDIGLGSRRIGGQIQLLRQDLPPWPVRGHPGGVLARQAGGDRQARSGVRVSSQSEQSHLSIAFHCSCGAAGECPSGRRDGGSRVGPRARPGQAAAGAGQELPRDFCGNRRGPHHQARLERGICRPCRCSLAFPACVPCWLAGDLRCRHWTVFLCHPLPPLSLRPFARPPFVSGSIGAPSRPAGIWGSSLLPTVASRRWSGRRHTSSGRPGLRICSPRACWRGR